MGRPKKEPGTHRDTLMQVRVTKEQYRLFQEAADATGLDLSGWVRRELLKEAKRQTHERLWPKATP